MKLINLINYYIQNDYINMDNKITDSQIKELLEELKKRNRNIIYCNIPNDFKHNDLVKLYFPNINFINYKYE